MQGLKWGRFARVGDPAPFDLPGLYRVSCLLSCSSKSHKIPPIMHQNSLFLIKNKFKKFGEGHSTSDCGRDPASFLDHFKHWGGMCIIHFTVTPDVHGRTYCGI